jgi:hypothetical protein
MNEVIMTTTIGGWKSGSPKSRKPTATKQLRSPFPTVSGWSITSKKSAYRSSFEIPSETVRPEFKQNGFRWSPAARGWQRHRSNRATYLAQLLLTTESKPKHV